MAAITQWFEQDLRKPVIVNYSKSTAFSTDNNSLVVGVRVYDDGAAAELSGNVVCHVIRDADGGTVTFNGMLSGNSVSATLPAACFAYAGPIAIMLQLVSGTAKTTLFKAVYNVAQGSTDTPIDPGSVVPNIDDLLAQISRMEKATDAAEAAADNAISNFAGEFSVSTTYTAGQYVTYTDGKFYRFTADHAAGAWNRNEVEAVTAGEELYALSLIVSRLNEGGLDIKDEIIEADINSWLDAHPEATTTVQDGAISAAKLDVALIKAYQKSETAIVCFPSISTGGYSGSTALMVIGGEATLFDASPTVNKAETLSYYNALFEAGIFFNIKNVVISHYHWDHYQCLPDILDAFPHIGCRAYLPMNPDGYYLGSDVASILEARDSVISTLSSRGIPYTETTQKTSFSAADGFCTVTLLNSSADAYSNYRENSPEIYNNFSMFSLAQIGDIYAAFPGDIQVEAQKYILAEYDLPRLFLYAVHHHGIQNDDDIAYLQKISPEWSVIQTSHTRGLVSAASAFAANYFSAHVGSSGYCSHEFAIQKDAGYIIGGFDIERSGWYYSYIDYYVDSEYSGTIHDGTPEHPYTNINEPNMFIKNNRNLNYRLHVVARETPYDLLWVRDMPLSIEIIGEPSQTIQKPVINGAYLKNTPEISFINIIFKKGRETSNLYGIVFAKSTTAYFNECNFIGDGKNYTPEHFGIIVSLGTIYLTECSFSSVNTPFIPYRYGEVITNGIVCSDLVSVYYTSALKVTIRSIDEIDASVDCYISAPNNRAIPVDISFGTVSEDVSKFYELCAKNDLTAISTPFVSRDYTGRVLPMQINGRELFAFGNISKAPILSGISLNAVTNAGFYAYGNDCTDKPGSSGGGLIVLQYSTSYFTQIATTNTLDDISIYIRKYRNGEYGRWAKINATQI